MLVEYVVEGVGGSNNSDVCKMEGSTCIRIIMVRASNAKEVMYSLISSLLGPGVLG